MIDVVVPTRPICMTCRFWGRERWNQCLVQLLVEFSGIYYDVRLKSTVGQHYAEPHCLTTMNVRPNIRGLDFAMSIHDLGSMKTQPKSTIRFLVKIECFIDVKRNCDAEDIYYNWMLMFVVLAIICNQGCYKLFHIKMVKFNKTGIIKKEKNIISVSTLWPESRS